MYKLLSLILKPLSKKKARHENLVEEIFEDLVEKVRKLLPGFGQKVAVDSTDIEAYSNGRRKVKSDPDARWGWHAGS